MLVLLELVCKIVNNMEFQSLTYIEKERVVRVEFKNDEHFDVDFSDFCDMLKTELLLISAYEAHTVQSINTGQWIELSEMIDRMDSVDLNYLATKLFLQEHSEGFTSESDTVFTQLSWMIARGSMDMSKLLPLCKLLRQPKEAA